MALRERKPRKSSGMKKFVLLERRLSRSDESRQLKRLVLLLKRRVKRTVLQRKRLRLRPNDYAKREKRLTARSEKLQLQRSKRK